MTEKPPAWAMEKAREIASHFERGTWIAEIAIALSEADTKARAKERERCAKWHEVQERAERARARCGDPTRPSQAAVARSH